MLQALLQKLVELVLYGAREEHVAGPTARGYIAIGYDSDLVVFDSSWKRMITNVTSLQGVGYTPYEGMEQSSA